MCLQEAAGCNTAPGGLGRCSPRKHPPHHGLSNGNIKQAGAVERSSSRTTQEAAYATAQHNRQAPLLKHKVTPPQPHSSHRGVK